MVLNRVQTCKQMKFFACLILVFLSFSVLADFDRTDPVQLQVLQDEVNLDPVNMGYSAVVNSTAQLLNTLNLAENNVVDTPDQFISEIFTSEVALDVIDPDETTVGAKFSEGQARWLDYLFSAADSLGADFALFETKFRALFSDYAPSSITLDALDARNRKLSRAEFLFGVGTIITRDDWFAARDF